ncbi:MAG: aminotransferase class I/II-fold pyridoxal phosphate-dependent enzyme [Planctomycetota bacterium]
MSSDRITERANKVEASGIRRMFELVASMTDPINLSIGQADFDVPEPVKEAAIQAIRSGFNRYTVTQGIPELNERIVQHYRESYDFRPESSLVTSGVSGGLLLAMLVLVEPGDEVLIPDPYFVMYKHLVNIAGGVPKYYDMYPSFRVTREALESQITEKTKVLLVNSPSNPTGAVLSADELTVIADVARQHDLTVISDEIYEAFVYGPRYRSMCQHLSETLVLGGFSKTYAMPGWRVGWAVGPKDILDAMRKLQQFSFVCAPSMAQQACVAALDVDMSEYIDEYRFKRNLVFDGLKERYSIVRPDGSFYMFPEVPEGLDEKRFIDQAIKHDVLLVPGSACSRRATHFRLSFAAPNDVLKRGIDILDQIAREAVS